MRDFTVRPMSPTGPSRYCRCRPYSPQIILQFPAKFPARVNFDKKNSDRHCLSVVMTPFF